MSPEALAGWVLGVLDACGDSPSPQQVNVIRARLEESLGVPAEHTRDKAPYVQEPVKRTKKVTRAEVLAAAAGPVIPGDLPAVERMG